MANYLSQPTKYGEPKSQFNAELASKVLQAKQGQYDINKARVDAVLGEYQNLEFINAKAKEDFYNNIQGVLNEVNSSNLRDLGDTNVADKILGSINKALTPETLKHNQVAKAYYASEKKWEKLYEKNPDKYDLGNKQYVERVSGINDYMQSGDYSKVRLGMLTNPIEYVNHQENGTKAIKALKDARGKEVHKWTDSSGLEYELDTSYLSTSDLFMLRDNIYTEKDRRQMRIEGSNMFGGMTNEQVQATIKGINDQKINQVNKDLKFFDSIKGVGYLGDAQKRNLIKNKAALEQYKRQLENYDYSQVASNENSFLYMVENQAISNLATTLGVDPSTSVKIPSHVYKKINDDKEAKKGSALGDDIREYILPTGPDDEKNLYKNRQEDLKSLNYNVDKQSKDIYEDMTRDKEQSEIDSTRELVIKNEAFKQAFPNATEEDIRTAYVDMFKDDYKTKAGDTSIEKKIEDMVLKRVERDELKGALDYAARIADKNMAADLVESIYDKIVDTPDWQDVIMTDVEGNVIDAREYLSDRGINSKENLLKFLESEDSKEFRASLYADASYRNLNGVRSGDNLFIEPTEGLRKSFSTMSSMLGEDLEIEDVFDFYMREADHNPLKEAWRGLSGAERERVKLTKEQIDELVETGQVQGISAGKAMIEVKPGLETSRSYNLLTKQGRVNNVDRVREGVEFKSTILSASRGRYARSLASESSIRNTADPKKYREEYNNALNQKGMGKVNVGFAIPSTKKDDPLHKQIETLSGAGTAIRINNKNLEKGEESRKFHLKNDRPTYVSYNRLTRELITVSQVNNDGDEVSVDVPVTTVSNLAPDLYNKIMDYNSQQTTKYKVDINKKNDNVKYITDEAITVQRANHYPPGLVLKATKKGAQNFLESGVAPGNDSQEVLQIIEGVLSNSSKFSIEVESSQSTESPYYRINMYQGEDNKVGELTPPRGQTEPTDQVWSVLEVMPAAHMTNILRAGIIDYNRRGNIEDSEILMNLREALTNINQ